MRTPFVLLALCITTAAYAQDYDAAGEQAMLDRINAVRAESNLAPLQRMPGLDAVARAHSAEMASRRQLEHVSPQSGTPQDRVLHAGIEASTIAENVALHQDSAHAMEALLQSPGHRANILNADVTHIGIGSLRTAQGVYVTQVFAELDQEQAPAIVQEDDSEEDEGDIFQLIPPFVQEAVQSAAQVAQPVAGAVTQAAPIAAPQLPTGPIAIAPIAPIAPVAPSAPVATAPAAPAAPNATPALPNANAVPIVNAETLRQLVAVAQALLGPAPAAPARQ
jgi:hypothetical protein